MTFSCCSGPFISSFHCETAQCQIQENICTTNSTLTTSIAVLYNGYHLAKNLVLCESTLFVSRYHGYDGSMVFQNCNFGSPQIRDFWLETEGCLFDCNQEILNQHFKDQYACFHERTVRFTLKDIGVNVVPMAVYPISLLIITKWKDLNTRFPFKCAC